MRHKKETKSKKKRLTLVLLQTPSSPTLSFSNSHKLNQENKRTLLRYIPLLLLPISHFRRYNNLPLSSNPHPHNSNLQTFNNFIQT